MAFRVVHGDPTAMAALSGQAIGQAARRTQEAEMAFRKQQEAAARRTQEAELAFRKQQEAAAAQRALETDYRNFQQQLALYRIQQSDAIAADLRQLDKQRAINEYKDQMEVEAEKRAHAWELEKRYRHSLIDEEAAQRQRANDIAELDAGIAEAEKITDPQQREAAMLALQLKKYRVSDIGSILRAGEEKEGMSPAAYSSLMTAVEKARNDLMSRSVMGPVNETGQATALPTAGGMPPEVRSDPMMALPTLQYFLNRQDIPEEVRKDIQDLLDKKKDPTLILQLDSLQPYIEAL